MRARERGTAHVEPAGERATHLPFSTQARTDSTKPAV